jgi:hypothetical protein
MLCVEVKRAVWIQIVQMGQREMPGVMAMDETPSADPDREVGLEGMNTAVRIAFAQIDMRDAVMRPRILWLQLQRALDGALRLRNIAAQLIGKSIHCKEIGIVIVGLGNPRHMPQETWPLILLAKNIIEKFRHLCCQQIARPVPGDVFQRIHCAQMILARPQREGVMEPLFAFGRKWQHRLGGLEIADAGRIRRVRLGK